MLFSVKLSATTRSKENPPLNRYIPLEAIEYIDDRESRYGGVFDGYVLGLTKRPQVDMALSSVNPHQDCSNPTISSHLNAWAISSSLSCSVRKGSCFSVSGGQGAMVVIVPFHKIGVSRRLKKSSKWYLYQPLSILKGIVYHPSLSLIFLFSRRGIRPLFSKSNW